MNKSVFKKKCVKYDKNVKKNKLPRKLYSNSISIEFRKIFEKIIHIREAKVLLLRKMINKLTNSFIYFYIFFKYYKSY